LSERQANSDAQLGMSNLFKRVNAERDEKEAIDEKNVVTDKLRHAKPKEGYQEKEENDLPREVEQTGRSGMCINYIELLKLFYSGH